MLQDMVLAAVNEALRAAQELAADKMGGVTGGLGGPAAGPRRARPARPVEPRLLRPARPAPDHRARQAARHRPAHRAAAGVPHPARLRRRTRCALADAIREVKERIGAVRDLLQPRRRAALPICQDERRDPTLICVVEEPGDVIPIERTHEYRGRYHVLGGALSPIDGVDPEDLKIAELLRARRRPARSTRGRARDQPDDHRRGDGAAHRRRRCASARPSVPSRASPAACPVGARPRVRRRGHARPRRSPAPQALCKPRAMAPSIDRHEVRRHLRRRRRAPQARRRADRAPSARRATASSPCSRRAARTTDELIAMAEEVSPTPDPREMDMLLSTGERISCALCAMAINDLGHQRDLADRLAGRHRHRHVAHQGAHPRRARRPHPRGARRGQDRAGRRLPGRLDRQGRHDARPRRLGHHRRRARRRARRRRVRDLHRRRRRLLAPTRGSCPTPASCRRLVRGDARDGGVRRRRAAAALGRVRAQPRRAHPLPIELRATRPVPSSSDEEETMERPPHHRRHPLRPRGPHDARRRARHARASPAASSPRWPTRTSTST